MNDILPLITKSFGLENLPPSVAENMLARIGDTIFMNVITRSVTLLPEDKHAAYETLLDTGAAGDDIFKFLAENVPDFKTVVFEEIASARETLGIENSF